MAGTTASNTPLILALTANALRGEAARARAAGMDEYLTKPVSLKLLGTRTWPGSQRLNFVAPSSSTQLTNCGYGRTSTYSPS